VVGDFLNADLIIDEITAHARGAVEIDPGVDTIFEIGGQDSKYISIANANPLDFDMNKVCAAGTGSFLHELANKYGINIVGEFQDVALSSDRPVKLAERCTVFMESDLVSYHQKGVPREDLIGGLCYAIVHNYLNRVVGKRKVGQKIMFLGGPSLNKGVVAAFEDVLGRGLIVPKHREVLGAYGAAISLQEKMAADGMPGSTFRGLAGAIHDQMDFAEKVCTADPNCHNQCKLKIYEFDGRRSIWGGECGRYELIRGKGRKQENFSRRGRKSGRSTCSGLRGAQRGKALPEVDGRPTVGMQRSLYTLQTGVLWAHFFDRLGFRLVLSPPTNSHIAAAGIESMTAETCFPVKVSHGHVRELAGKTAYLFLPAIITMPTPEEQETGFIAPWFRPTSTWSARLLALTERRCSARHPPQTRSSHPGPGDGGANVEEAREEQETDQEALEYAWQRQEEFQNELHQKGREILEAHDPETPLVVVTGQSLQPL
jgi:predicted CoA-substrate-specific enzyme activase